jgi:glycosidase
MHREAIYHTTYSEYSHAIDDNTVIIRIRTGKNDIKQCYVCLGDRMCPDNPISVETVVMAKVAQDKLFDYFEAKIRVAYTRICYYFILFDGKMSVYYYNNEFYETLAYERQLYFQFHYLRQEDIAHVPQWAKEAVIYQIFPDSFVASKGDFLSEGISITLGNNLYSRNRLGGTLDGILENLGYLVDLGINCIYLNPIFTARSYHKYDTIDYFSIDPCFGDNEKFKRLVEKCHELNIRVILDGVFNHCGTSFFAFMDVLEKQEASKYRDWFFIKDFPVKIDDPPNYVCFAYVKDMPKLNTGNPKVKDYFLDVATYWIKEADIDGWRFDVADEVNHDFWREFRKSVKSVKKDAFLIGEVWDGSKAFLQGDQFDSLMNYGFTNACVDFFAKRSINAEQFDARVNFLLMRYKQNIQYAQMNLLGSHDTTRFLSLCGGDVRKLKLAALFLMTHVGIPSIYYGDEKGLTGIGKDEEYRKPMLWMDDSYSKEIFNFYKKLVSIRRRYMPIMLGNYTTVKADIGKNLYVFSRREGEEKLTIALNNGERVQNLELSVENERKEVCDILNDTVHTVYDKKIIVELPPFSGRILLA